MTPVSLRPTSQHDQEVAKFMEGLVARNPGESEFHQAVQEVVETLMPFIDANPRYAEAKILERLTEPDRIVTFKVTWEDDQGQARGRRRVAQGFPQLGFQAAALEELDQALALCAVHACHGQAFTALDLSGQVARDFLQSASADARGLERQVDLLGAQRQRVLTRAAADQERSSFLPRSLDGVGVEQVA